MESPGIDAELVHNLAAEGLSAELRCEPKPILIDVRQPEHLGPNWYIGNQELRLKTGDKITVTGSGVRIGGKPAIISSDIRRGEDILKLRDSDGTRLRGTWTKGVAR